MASAWERLRAVFVIVIYLLHPLSKDEGDLGADKLHVSASGSLEVKRQPHANGRTSKGQSCIQMHGQPL